MRHSRASADRAGRAAGFRRPVPRGTTGRPDGIRGSRPCESEPLKPGFGSRCPSGTQAGIVPFPPPHYSHRETCSRESPRSRSAAPVAARGSARGGRGTGTRCEAPPRMGDRSRAGAQQLRRTGKGQDGARENLARRAYSAPAFVNPERGTGPLLDSELQLAAATAGLIKGEAFLLQSQTPHSPTGGGRPSGTRDGSQPHLDPSRFTTMIGFSRSCSSSHIGTSGRSGTHDRYRNCAAAGGASRSGRAHAPEAQNPCQPGRRWRGSGAGSGAGPFRGRSSRSTGLITPRPPRFRTCV